MKLWVDKYRPTSLVKLDYHKDQAEQLRKLVECGDFPHLLFYGPSGAGKKTRIMCLLRELYGTGVEKLRLEKLTFDTPSNKKLEIHSVASNYHIEVTPSDCGFNDRVVIQEVLKSVAQTNQIDASAQRAFKVVVLNEVDRLTRDAQHALRRTMEKYVASCRIVLVCQSTSRVIPAIRSRCLCVRVSAPTQDDVARILQQTCKKEGLSLPGKLADKIAAKSQRNLRRALLMCEATRVKQYPFAEDQEVAEADWELYLKETASLIVQEQSAQRLLVVRERIYELLQHLIPADVIFKSLLEHVARNGDVSLRCRIAEEAAFYEHRMQLGSGSKEIFHIEAFIARVMEIYRRSVDGLDA